MHIAFQLKPSRTDENILCLVQSLTMKAGVLGLSTCSQPQSNSHRQGPHSSSSDFGKHTGRAEFHLLPCEGPRNTSAILGSGSVSAARRPAGTVMPHPSLASSTEGESLSQRSLASPFCGRFPGSSGPLGAYSESRLTPSHSIRTGHRSAAQSGKPALRGLSYSTENFWDPWGSVLGG